ncbi:family 43 glycosylhydrolase [Bifidobacterium oedipodis]|uniref:Glycosyl hydrolase family 43 n=1 Tax=Bifidobacterium oedipodis TaxID=2675322 RepID=A0A7Y0HUT5_9BIFI|nr:family 43 glycosylhydrolase [Bifidobacterium sp. DSM 109957]NMM95104.1 glycosyl hydrolase family 43 [Bifidobacterium sp. DSM 109957]
MPSCEQPVIINGVPWFDDQGNIVNAHGSCVVQDNGRWYLFGEYKTDAENEFNGFSCYSSPDLAHWHFERMALPVQENGSRLGPHRVGERVKVMRCPSTGQYVMFAHSDDLRYMDPCIVVAVSNTIDGEYQVLGPLTHDGEPIRMWDMGTFQDTDGTGYLMTHEGNIYRLADDYLSAAQLVASNIAPGGESPAMMHAGDTYFIMFSNKTSWDRNDNYYLSAPSPSGPWTNRGLFCPEGTCTWNSQCSFIFPLTLASGETHYIYTGDRWSYPHQASSASTVWMPIHVDGDTISIPEYWQAWNPLTARPVPLPGNERAIMMNTSYERTTLHVAFSAADDERMALLANTDRDGGYAQVTIQHNASGRTVLSLPVDLYSPTPFDGIVLVTPALHTGDYTLAVRVRGDASVFYKKDGTRLGSTGTRVRITGIQTIASPHSSTR